MAKILTTVSYKVLFFAIYVIATLVSFFFIGASFVFAEIVKIDSVAFVGTVLVIGLVGPLAAANYSIERWKKSISGEIGPQPITIKRVVIGFADLIIVFLTLIVTAGSAVLIGTWATDGETNYLFEVLGKLIGLPALLVGAVFYAILKVTLDMVLEKLRWRNAS